MDELQLYEESNWKNASHKASGKDITSLLCADNAIYLFFVNHDVDNNTGLFNESHKYRSLGHKEFRFSIRPGCIIVYSFFLNNPD